MKLSEARAIATGPVTFGDERAIEARKFLALYEEAARVSSPVPCWEPGCIEDGAVNCECDEENDDFETDPNCPDCNGTGFRNCPTCKGEEVVKLADLGDPERDDLEQFMDAAADAGLLVKS